MADHPKTPRTPTLDLHSIFWVPKTAALKEIGKVYKSLVTKKHADKSSHKEKNAEDPVTPSIFEPNDHQRGDDDFFSSPAFLSRTTSRRSKTPTPSKRPLSRNSSRRCKTPNPLSSASRSTNSEPEISAASLSRIMSRRDASKTETPRPAAAFVSKNMSRQCNSEPEIPDFAASPSEDVGRRSSLENEIPTASLSGNMSRRSTTPIIFSQTTVRRKPPPIEKKLECKLENLCFGGVKKIKITRDVIKPPGVILQEEEVLKIEVQPGWRKGTKITFEEKGNEEPGYLPADIVFSIDEKEHPLFSRDGDNLEICVRISLANALTGCSIPVPLLGGETMTLSFENIVIYPEYVKIIKGQGMPNPKQGGTRGDLHIKFLIEFPTELSDEQREEAVSFLQDCY